MPTLLEGERADDPSSWTESLSAQLVEPHRYVQVNGAGSVRTTERRCAGEAQQDFRTVYHAEIRQKLQISPPIVLDMRDVKTMA